MTLKPQLDKCSPDNQALYYGIVEAIKSELPACKNPVMNIVKQDTCQLETAGYCVAMAMPFLSPVAIPDYQLCWYVVQFIL